MIKKFVAAAAVSGALTLGAGAGVASAATTPSSAPGATHAFDCAKAPKRLERLQHLQQRAQTRLPKLQAALAKAQHDGKTKRADVIQRLINRVQRFLKRAPERVKRIESACPGVQPATGSPSTTS